MSLYYQRQRKYTEGLWSYIYQLFSYRIMLIYMFLSCYDCYSCSHPSVLRKSHVNLDLDLHTHMLIIWVWISQRSAHPLCTFLRSNSLNLQDIKVSRYNMPPTFTRLLISTLPDFNFVSKSIAIRFFIKKRNQILMYFMCGKKTAF